MTEEDWDALLINVPEEVKKWFAFIGHGEGADHHNHQPHPSLADGSNKQSFGVEDKKEEQDLPIWRVLREFYGHDRLRPSPVGHEGPRAQPRQQSPRHSYEQSRV